MENTINNLIKLNYDRVAGFEKAGNDLEADDQTILQPIFSRLAGESRQYITELTDLLRQYSADPADGTSTTGDLHRAWIDIKATFTGNDVDSVLDECERGEDAIKAAYEEVLQSPDDLNIQATELVQRQYEGIKAGHDLIRSLREEAKETDEIAGAEPIQEPVPGFPISPGSADPATTAFAPQPSFEGAAGEYDRTNIPEPETIEQEEAWEAQVENEADNNKLMEFFINELRDLLWAERELTETLPDLAEAATSAELRAAFEKHLTETETHVTRLEQVFGILGLEVETRKCEAMAGIIDEGDDIISATEDGTAQRDVGLIFAGQKAEHYEIASYGGMIALAKTLGYYEVAELLAETLEEEKIADATLTEIAEGHANEDARREPAEE